MSDFNPGQHIGDYEVISILGAGGMGKVYKVRNLISDRTEALKVLLPDLTSQQSLADRFLREIRLLAGHTQGNGYWSDPANAVHSYPGPGRPVA